MDFKKQKPIYLQIAEQLCERMLQDEWKEGERMSSVRDVAADLGVNPNTVQRSFAWLEENALIFNRRGIGYFVDEQAKKKIIKIHRDEFINEEWPEVLRRMEVMGLRLENNQLVAKD